MKVYFFLTLKWDFKLQPACQPEQQLPYNKL